MKKNGILNPLVSRVIAETGHKDLMVVSDAGLPIPLGVERIDLALVKNMPRFLDVLREIVNDLSVEKIVVAEELRTESPGIYRGIRELLPVVEMEEVPHVEFKERTKKARAVIRSGEFSPYANIILVGGVVY